MSSSTSRPEPAPRRARRLGGLVTAAVATQVVLATPAAAHNGPDEGEAAYVMADWMLMSFLVFFLTALVVFLVVLKRGLLRNPEAAKMHLLSIDEPDYYTPDWARDGA